MIDLDIPTFLRIPQEVRRESWRGRKLTKPKAATVKITRNEDASTRAFRRMIEKKEAEKKASRFAMLRERAAEKKRQASWVPVAERKPSPSKEGRCERPDDAGEHGADAAARSVVEGAHEGPHLLFTVQIVHVEAERCQRIVNSLRGGRAGGVLRSRTCSGVMLVVTRWGMPPPPRAGGFPVTNIRNTTSPHWRGWL
jgi:hypothetical protein